MKTGLAGVKYYCMTACKSPICPT